MADSTPMATHTSAQKALLHYDLLGVLEDLSSRPSDGVMERMMMYVLDIKI